MINSLSVRNVREPILNVINEDLKADRSSDEVLIFADKTRNIYKTTADNNNRLLTENITKSYKHGNNDMVDDMNEELKLIAKDLSIDDRVDIMAKKNAFITLKDHKENFESNPKCQLLNPTKSELGKISKAIVDNINDTIRETLGVNQWKNTQSVIHWFKNIRNKPNDTFLSFDIVEFYPSISKELLDRAILWEKTFVDISDANVRIIRHASKSVLFSGEQPWIKRNNDSMFDVTMGSFDGAEICELVGLFILNDLTPKFGKEYVGLYRDDGLLLLRGTNGRAADRARKDLNMIFQHVGLKITAEVKHHTVNFLDITLNLRNGENPTMNHCTLTATLTTRLL